MNERPTQSNRLRTTSPSEEIANPKVLHTSKCRPALPSAKDQRHRTPSPTDLSKLDHGRGPSDRRSPKWPNNDRSIRQKPNNPNLTPRQKWRPFSIPLASLCRTSNSRWKWQRQPRSINWRSGGGCNRICQL